MAERFQDIWPELNADIKPAPSIRGLGQHVEFPQKGVGVPDKLQSELWSAPYQYSELPSSNPLARKAELNSSAFNRPYPTPENTPTKFNEIAADFLMKGNRSHKEIKANITNNKDSALHQFLRAGRYADHPDYPLLMGMTPAEVALAGGGMAAGGIPGAAMLVGSSVPQAYDAIRSGEVGKSVSALAPLAAMAVAPALSKPLGAVANKISPYVKPGIDAVRSVVNTPMQTAGNAARATRDFAGPAVNVFEDIIGNRLGMRDYPRPSPPSSETADKISDFLGLNKEEKQREAQETARILQKKSMDEFYKDLRTIAPNPNYGPEPVW